MVNKKKAEYISEKTSCYDVMKASDIKEMDKYIERYMEFLQKNKTERLVVNDSMKTLEKNGFVDIETMKGKKWQYKDLVWKKVYFNFRGKNLFATVLGKKDLSGWVRLLWSHVDSPRIDLKYKPVIENNWICLLKSHYYGGIKKYQWLTIPLSIMWVIYDKKGNKIEISIWENEKDPVLFLSDLLPHLWREQMKKTADKVIEWEEMNIIIGSKYSAKQEETVKENILKILFDKYGITEDSFSGADLSLVPAQKVRYVWFDKSMVWWYGQDDRSCSFAWLQAILDLKSPTYTGILYFSDKEEIWSTWTTGAQSRALTYFVQEIMDLYMDNVKMIDVDRCFFNSYGISADVTAIIDPNFDSVSDKNNSCFINYGPALEKFTGHGGKYEWSEADAEFVQKLKSHFAKNHIVYQFSGLGKIDVWWGATICKYLAHLWFNIIDMGIGVLNMHSPFEVSSCADLFMTYKAYHSFLNME